MVDVQLKLGGVFEVIGVYCGQQWVFGGGGQQLVVGGQQFGVCVVVVVLQVEGEVIGVVEVVNGWWVDWEDDGVMDFGQGWEGVCYQVLGGMFGVMVLVLGFECDEVQVGVLV